MKLTKKIISMVVAVIMAVTTFMVMPATNADAAVKVLYPKKMKFKLEVGENNYVMVKQKGVTFTSSNKKIAKVSKKGNVVARKVGQCTITVKKGTSKKKVKITVFPSTPKIKSASVSGSNSATSLAQMATIKATWKPVKGAAGYTLYCSDKKSGGYKSVNVSGGKKTSGTISKLVYGKTYYVKIKSYAKYKGKKVMSPDFSEVKSVKTYVMKWNDEFNGNELDRNKWNWNDATGWGGYGNRELQNYQPEYSKVENGSFVIMPTMYWDVDKKEIMNDDVENEKQKKCYSTKVWTRPDQNGVGGYTTKYGKIEFRAKLPKGEGTWAACWMLGMLDAGYANRYEWPTCGEIDVLETTFAKTKTKIPQTIHCSRFNGMSTSTGSKNVTTVIPTATSQYHTYAIEWTDKEIRFYIDGQYTWTYSPASYVTSGDGTNDATIWPYKNPCYLILNCAVGGVLGVDSSATSELMGNVSNVNPEGWTKIGNYNNVPNKNIEIYRDYMYVDYVRVYQ